MNPIAVCNICAIEEADLIALKITPDGSFTASVGAIAQALQWVLDYREIYNIVAINISFGGGNVPKGTPLAAIEPLYQALNDAGIFIAVASGNRLREVRVCHDLEFEPAACPSGGLGAPDRVVLTVEPVGR